MPKFTDTEITGREQAESTTKQKTQGEKKNTNPDLGRQQKLSFGKRLVSEVETNKQNQKQTETWLEGTHKRGGWQDA